MGSVTPTQRGTTHLPPKYTTCSRWTTIIFVDWHRTKAARLALTLLLHSVRERWPRVVATFGHARVCLIRLYLYRCIHNVFPLPSQRDSLDPFEAAAGTPLADLRSASRCMKTHRRIGERQWSTLHTLCLQRRMSYQEDVGFPRWAARHTQVVRSFFTSA